MRFCIFLSIVIVVGVVPSVLDAQDMGIFSGQGIRGPESKSTEATKSNWPRLLDFSKAEKNPPSQNPFSKMFTRKPSVPKSNLGKSGFDIFKSSNSGVPESLDKPKPFGSITDLFPKRDPSRPNLFQQMNTKSKDMFDKTTNWAQQKNRKLKDKSTGTWDAITRDWRDIEAHNRATQPAQPPIRSANSNDKPPVRF